MRRLAITCAGLAFALPSVALAAPRTLKELAGTIVDVLNSATALLVLAGFVIYLAGVSLSVWRKEGGKKEVRTYFLWGVLVLFVMVSIWGILRILQDSLFNGSQYNPTTGSQQPAQTILLGPSSF